MKKKVELKGYYPFETCRGKGAKGTKVYSGGKLIDAVVSNPSNTAEFYRKKGYVVRIRK